MNNDIVRRLRSYWGGESFGDVSRDVAEAADEIERLQVEVAYWKEQVEILRNK